jgi:hypothetical protein
VEHTKRTVQRRARRQSIGAEQRPQEISTQPRPKGQKPAVDDMVANTVLVSLRLILPRCIPALLTGSCQRFSERETRGMVSITSNSSLIPTTSDKRSRICFMQVSLSRKVKLGCKFWTMGQSSSVCPKADFLHDNPADYQDVRRMIVGPKAHRRIREL